MIEGAQARGGAARRFPVVNSTRAPVATTNASVANGGARERLAPRELAAEERLAALTAALRPAGSRPTPAGALCGQQAVLGRGAQPDAAPPQARRRAIHPVSEQRLEEECPVPRRRVTHTPTRTSPRAGWPSTRRYTAPVAAAALAAILSCALTCPRETAASSSTPTADQPSSRYQSS